MNRPLVLAIDLSTTACKALAFEPGGAPVASARAALAKVSPQPGWQEQDSQDWWMATSAALAELMAQVDAADVVALCLTHQRETFVCLDEDGAALRPAILWLDTRAASQVRRLGSKRIHDVSGKPPSTTPSLYKLAWLADHEPDVLRRTSTVADVHAYLARKLTGRRVTSWASADPSGLVDMRTFEYSPELLAPVGLRLDQLPELVAPGVIIGEISGDAAIATGLPAGLPVVAGAGDGSAPGWGSHLRGRARISQPGYRSHAGNSFRAEPREPGVPNVVEPGRGQWTLEAVLASGALSLAWFGREVARDDSPDAYQRLEAAATSVEPGSEGLLFLPYISGVGTPYWDAAARGAWVGLRERHGLADMYRAVLEGIADEQRMALSMMGAEVGSDAVAIRAMGGGTRSSLWVQVLADILGKPVEVTRQSETTALGAAILAAAAVCVDGEGGAWRPRSACREAGGRSSRAQGAACGAIAGRGRVAR